MRVVETWTTARVRSARDVTPSIRLFELVPAEGSPAQIPLGGHLNVTVMVGDRADTRSYSLIGPALPDAYRIAVKLSPESRGGSAYMWSLKPGAQLSISSPRSHFGIDFDRPDYLVIAGGIGITPMVGMAHALARGGAQLRMMYCARTREELAFAGDLQAVLGERLQTFVSAEGERLDLRAVLSSLAPGGIAAVCGLSIDRVNIALHALIHGGRLRMVAADRWVVLDTQGVTRDECARSPVAAGHHGA